MILKLLNSGNILGFDTVQLNDDKSISFYMAMMHLMMAIMLRMFLAQLMSIMVSILENTSLQQIIY